jgi:hypothetical protein
MKKWRRWLKTSSLDWPQISTMQAHRNSSHKTTSAWIFMGDYVEKWFKVSSNDVKYNLLILFIHLFFLITKWSLLSGWPLQLQHFHCSAHCTNNYSTLQVFPVYCVFTYSLGRGF